MGLLRRNPHPDVIHHHHALVIPLHTIEAATVVPDILIARNPSSEFLSITLSIWFSVVVCLDMVSPGFRAIVRVWEHMPPESTHPESRR